MFAELQRAGAIGMRVDRKDSTQDSTVIMIRRNSVTPEVLAAASELPQLLGIRRDAPEYTIAFGEVAKSDTELAMLKRSTLSIMVEMAGEVRVPAAQVADGRAPNPCCAPKHMPLAAVQAVIGLMSVSQNG